MSAFELSISNTDEWSLDAQDQAVQRVKDLERRLGQCLSGWALRVEPAAGGVWARLSVRWNGVSLHVDQESTDVRSVLDRGFEAMARLLEVPTTRRRVPSHLALAAVH